MKNLSLPTYELKIFRAVDDRQAALDFHDGHNAVLANMRIEGLCSGEATWLENPGVFIFGLYSKDKIAAGLRMHVEHPDYRFPFEKALESCKIDVQRILAKDRHLVTAEGCGLWASRQVAGPGVVDLMNRVTTACANYVGVDKFYAICPRHTLDAFKKVGFYMGTLDDELINFPYPSERFSSYMIHCNMADLGLAFQQDRKVIDEILKNPEGHLIVKGRKEEFLVSLTGFPVESLLEVEELGLEEKIGHKEIAVVERRKA